MRTSLHRWLASDFTASLPDLVDEAWDVLAAGLPGTAALTLQRTPPSAAP